MNCLIFASCVFGKSRDLPAVSSPAFLESRFVDDFTPDESATDAFTAYRAHDSALVKRISNFARIARIAV